MNVSDLYGTLYSPGDGTIDPAGWASALTRGATNKGAKVLYYDVDYFNIKLILKYIEM